MTPSKFWLDGWCVCLNFAMDFADNFVFDDPLTFCYFLEGEFAVNIFRFGSHSWIFLFHWVQCAWIILVIFVSPSLAWLNYLEIISPISVWLNSSRIVRILFSCELDWLEFAVFKKKKRLGPKLPYLFQFLFYFIVSFCFLRTLLRFCSCFVWSNTIHLQLKLLARALVSDVCFI